MEYINVVIRSALDAGLSIMIGGDMNANIWELDGGETENGRRMKEMGLHIFNCVWDWLNEATMYTEETETYTGICV